MALVGLSIGGGRDAYRSPEGQLAAFAAIAMVVACWLWSAILDSHRSCAYSASAVTTFTYATIRSWDSQQWCRCYSCY